MRFLIFIFVLFSSLDIYGQAEDNKRLDTLKLPDTLKSINTKIPLIYLKSMINKNQLGIQNFAPRSQKLVKLYSEGAVKEDFASGLSDDQLLAYLKNKNTLKEILHQKYEANWWYRVKGIDELLGIPSEVFFVLKILFLLAQ